MANIYHRTRQRRRHVRTVAIGVVALLVVVLTVLGARHALRPSASVDTATAPDVSTGAEPPAEQGAPPAMAEGTEAPVEPQAPPEPELSLRQGVIERGDTLSSLLGEFVSPQELHALAQKCEDIFSLTRICAGQAYAITTTEDRFHGFEYEIDDTEKLNILRHDDGFTVRRVPIPYDVVLERVDGEIESSLYGAVEASGETPELAVRLSDIFAWDVDFIRDIRVGDTFTALVEKRYREGDFVGYGRILAAEFVNQGESHQGYLFEAEEGRPAYYDPEGGSLRKAFLKAPLAFRRISSGYNPRRMHPILKVVRPHPGIDYAAPTGTPVKTVGDGRVITVARDKAAGKYVKVRHNSVYETTYMHLSRFARGLKKGKRVQQGDVIGYVGSTGYSTGPHLDFRMKKNGRYVNPTKIKTPAAAGVPEDKLDHFMAHMELLRSELAPLGSMQAEKAGQSVSAAEADS